MTNTEFVKIVEQKVLEQGILDSLEDPWDQEHTGNQYSSVRHDIRKIIELTIEEYQQLIEN